MIGSILTHRRNRSAFRVVATSLAAVIAISPISVCAADPVAAPASTSVPGIRTIALFQSANDAGASGEVAASAVDSAVKWRLNASGTYQATSFSTLLPAVQRALTLDTSDAALTNSDVQQPVTSAASAQKIARVMATDGYLIEEIDSYREDQSSHEVSITVSGSLFSTSTGTAARTFAVTGTASPQSTDEADSAVMLRAADSVAAQIATTLGAGAPQGKSVLANSKSGGSSSGIGSGLLIVLAAALAGILAHNVSTHSNSGSSSGSTTSTGSTGGGSGFGPPPPPP